MPPISSAAAGRGGAVTAAAATPVVAGRLRPALRHRGAPAQHSAPQLQRAARQQGWAATAAAPGGGSTGSNGAATATAAGGLSLQQQDQLCEELMAFLREDLTHLFDDQGIDASKYDERVTFEDPITKYSSIQGYLFNIAMLRRVFAPTFTLHDIRRTGPLELTTRWTMTMCLSFAKGGPLQRLFDPRLTFTGTSIMGINPATGRFNRHVDTWDAIQQQGYFSLEAFVHMLSQVADLRKGPEAAGAQAEAEVLLKRSRYEVRRYRTLPPGAATLPGGSSGAAGGGGSGGVYAVASFGGDAAAAAAADAERALRAALLQEGQQPGEGGWLVAAPPEVGPLRRNEVLIPLRSFQLW